MEMFPRQPVLNPVCHLLIGSSAIWLGMRKPDDFSDVCDFRYYSDRKRIEYQYWSTLNPDYKLQNEYCVVTRPYDDDRWNDIPCTLLEMFICQL